MNLRCKHVARTGVTVTTRSQCNPPAKRDDAVPQTNGSHGHMGVTVSECDPLARRDESEVHASSAHDADGFT